MAIISAPKSFITAFVFYFVQPRICDCEIKDANIETGIMSIRSKMSKVHVRLRRNAPVQFILPVRPQAKISSSLVQTNIPRQVNLASNAVKPVAASSSARQGNVPWNWAAASNSKLVQEAPSTMNDVYSQAWEYRALKRKEGYEYALTQQALFRTMEEFYQRNLALKSSRIWNNKAIA